MVLEEIKHLSLNLIKNQHSFWKSINLLSEKSDFSNYNLRKLAF